MFLMGRCRQPAFLRIYTECPITVPKNRAKEPASELVQRPGRRLQSGIWLSREIGSNWPFSAGTSRLATSPVSLSGSSNAATRPAKGWSTGNYRVEIYVGDDLVTAAKFTITAKKSTGDDEDDDEDEDGSLDD